MKKISFVRININVQASRKEKSRYSKFHEEKSARSKFQEQKFSRQKVP